MYAEHGAMLLAYATRWNNGDRQHGEDAVQETFVRAWRHPMPANSTARAERSWLLTVARNVCIDRHRARQSRPREIGGDALQAVDAETGADEIERAVEQWTIAEALANLSADHREVLEETFFRGRSVAETATRLGIPQGTVKSRSFNALRALRKALVARGVSA
jgi:RNA polymerase sigma-70 factor (ECF subfamily)